MSDINYPGDRPLNSATDSVTVVGSVTSSGIAAIDQTTPGVTNGVQVNAPLPVGANVIGKVSIDQTTPGTTNAVQVIASLPAGSNTIGAVTQSGSWSVSALQSGSWSISAVQSGTWNINNVSGTISLPTGAATSAKQPALGTSGSAASDVLTVQGIAGMTALKVDGSGTTQPVSGSVTVTQATAANLNATVTGTVAATQSGTWNINNVSGTVSLPTGAATSAKQPALGTSGTPSSDVITVQGVTGMTALKVDGSAVTQPVSGSVTVSGTVAATQSGTWNVNNITGTVSLPTGAALASKQPSIGTAGSPSPDVISVQGVSGGQSMGVFLSQAPPASGGRISRLLYRNDYSSVNVTTSAYVQVTASVTGNPCRWYIADTSGSAIILATGAAGAEIDRLYIGPGGNDAPYELVVASGTRVAIKALDVNATSGQIIITALE